MYSVFIAEHTTVVRAALRRVFAAEDEMRIVGESGDGRALLAMLLEQKPNVLLLDLELPGLDWEAFYRAMNAAGPHPHLIGILPSEESGELLLRAVRMGACGIILRSELSSMVVEGIRRVRAGETFLDPHSTSLLLRQFTPARGSEPREGTLEPAQLTRREREIVLLMGAMARRAQDAEEASRAKSRLLADMSHELRTPLNAILGFTELLHNGAVGPVNDKQKEFLKDCMICSRHLRQVINDLLDLAKLEAGKMEACVEEVDPATVLQEVIDVLQSTAIPKRIRLELTGKAGRVNTDPTKFRQIVHNYVSNAIKFAPEGGRVEVRLELVESDRFQVEVIDNGPGITAEQIELLFNRFQQLNTPNRPPGGTGLGLALSKELAELLGGEVGVTSVPGEGSTFRVLLPVEGQTVRPQPKEIPQGGPRPKILVVDDERNDRTFLRRELGRIGYRVETASNLRKAIEKCQTTRYDAITLDLVLEGDDGTDLLKELGNLNRQTPVIVVSVKGDAIRHCQSQIHAQLRKPVRLSELFRSLNSAGVQPLTVGADGSLSDTLQRSLGSGIDEAVPSREGALLC